MDRSIESKYSFGDVIVDPQTLLIQVAGKEKRLEPKLIALLTYLAKHSQQVLSRQQITEAVWPKVVVVEESVTQAIFALRNALNDDAKRPKYIETIPRRGYRFLADVVFCQEEEALPEAPHHSKITKRSPHRRNLAAGLMLLLGLTLLWLYNESRSRYEIANILPVTSMPGAECCVAINNERKMVFINVRSKIKDLYVKDLTNGTQQRITQDEWQKGIPLWLDNTTLIYPRCSSSECQIVRQNLSQSPQVIYSSVHYIGEITLRLSNPNLLVFNEEQDMSEFIEFDLRSGKYEPLRNRYPDLPPHILHPILSQDTSQLFFVNIDPKPVLMALDLVSKKLTQISDQFDEINSYSIDSQQQLFIAGAYGSTTGVWLLQKASGKPQLVVRASGDEKLQFPLADPREKALYYQSVLLDQNIGMVTDSSNKLGDFSALNSTSVDNLASLSQDQQFLYFISNRTGFSEVWRYDFTTQQSKAVTQMKFTGVSSVLVSNDGQRFSASYIDNMQSTLGIFSIHNGELLASIKSQSRPLSWSNDDQYLYTRDNQHKIPVLMRYHSQTLEPTTIKTHAGLVAQESVDGKALIYFDMESKELRERNLASGQEQRLISIDTADNGIRTSLFRINTNNNSVFAVKYSKQVHELWQYPFISADAEQDLTPRKLLDLPKDVWITYVNKDGTLVLYDKEMPPAGSIMKVNFE